MAKKCVFAQNITKSLAKDFNGYKRTIDRKYALKQVFDKIRPEFGFKLEHYQGSNQIILKKDGRIIYNSDDEGSLGSSRKFKIFFNKQVGSLLCRGK